MKKFFSNISWKMLFVYAIICLVISVLFDWISGRYNEPDLKLSKVIIGYIVQVFVFCITMSLIFGKRFLQSFKKENEKQN